jgi:imidazolonepropionase-like amidohydrolase
MTALDRIAAWIRRWKALPQDGPAHRGSVQGAGGPGRWEALPRSGESARGPSFALRAGWLIDGAGGPVRRMTRIEVIEGFIGGIEDAPAPEGCAAGAGHTGGPILDFSQCTLLPGLVDSHVHLAMAGSADEALRVRLRQASADVVCQTIQENLRELLRCGVVAVRDAGGARGSALRFAKGLQHRSGPAVRVCAAGRGWHRQGRYGRFIGRPADEGLGLGPSILKDDSPCDVVKIVNSGVNSLTEFGRRTAPQFSLAEMAAAVKACRKKGLPVMVHANGEEPVRIAVAAGCTSVEHGYFMGADNLERMAEMGTVWVPTVVPMQAYARQPEPAGRGAQVARRTVDHQLEQIWRARGLHVTMALGTDSGSPGVEHGVAVIEEMKLLMAAGFTLSETVRCAALNGARLTGGDSGLLEEGRPATFVVVPGTPSDLPDSLSRVRAVYVDGERVLAAG